MSNTNYWEQIEEAFNEVDIYETYEVFKKTSANYPDWKIDLLAVHWTMSEIVNGGLTQYFENHTAVLAPEAVIGLQRIGKPELAAILQKAMTLLGEPYPRDRQQRIQLLSALTGSEPGESEGFSLIPKWVAKQAGMKSKPNPFEAMDDLLESSGDSVEAAMDEYAISKAG